MRKLQFKKPSIKAWQIMVTVVAFALGILLTYQFRVAENVRQEQHSQSERLMGMQAILDRTIQQRESKEKEVADLRKKVDNYEKAVTANQLVPDNTVKELDSYRMAAGLVPAEGPGIILTIDDSKEVDGYKIYNYPFLLMDIINILRYADAEAIDLGGQRITGNSEIVRSGINILVNRVPIPSPPESPYTIVAIGDANKLKQYLINSKVLQFSSNTTYQIQSSSSLTVQAVPASSRFKLAQPVKEKSGK